MHILYNLPAEYEVAVGELEENLKDTINPLDTEEIWLNRRPVKGAYMRPSFDVPMVKWSD